MKEKNSFSTDAFDWTEARRRVALAGEAIEKGGDVSPEVKREVLLARARALAKVPDSECSPESLIEVVEFVVAQECYAVSSDFVREVYPLREFTPLPCTPSFVMGVINVRGKIVSVVDIKKFFSLPEKGFSDLNKVIILHDEDMQFGILADQVLGVRMLRLAEIQAALPTLQGIRAKYLRGLTSSGLVVLDALKLLRDKEMVVNDEVST